MPSAEGRRGLVPRVRVDRWFRLGGRNVDALECEGYSRQRERCHGGSLSVVRMGEGVASERPIESRGRHLPHFVTGAPAMSITISLDPARQDLDAIHEILAGTYWSPGIRREVVADRATFAWLCDVFVVAVWRGQGHLPPTHRVTRAPSRLADGAPLVPRDARCTRSVRDTRLPPSARRSLDGEAGAEGALAGCALTRAAPAYWAASCQSSASISGSRSLTPGTASRRSMFRHCARWCIPCVATWTSIAPSVKR
ncbi:MAG: hypothetical protein RLZZ116_887 [Planctomycetota bacterium]